MITSTANGHIRKLIQLRDKSKARNKEGLFLAEGIRMFEETPVGSLKEVYCSESLFTALQNKDGQDDGSRHDKVLKKLRQCEEKGIFTEQVTAEVFKKISDTQTPQGILFVAKQLTYSLKEMIDKATERAKADGRAPLFLLLEDIQDPGNLGTMIRTGEGAGVDGIIMSKGTVDIYNPKTIRSTMGSLYRVPVIYQEDLEKAVGLLKRAGITTYAAHLKGEKYFDELPYDGGSAFLVGNEGNGLKKETADMADTYIKIPMEGSLESLNASVAAALLMYQAAGANRKKVERYGY